MKRREVYIAAIAAVVLILVTSPVTSDVNYDLGKFILTQSEDGTLTLTSSNNPTEGIPKTFSAHLGLSVPASDHSTATPKFINSKLTGIDFGPSARVEIEYPNPECTTFTWTTVSLLELRDCLDYGTAQWFGGPEQKLQLWPVQKLVKQDYSYVTKEQDNMAIAERLWFTSEGNYVHVSPDVPLFIDSNATGDNQLCLVSKFADPYLIQGAELKLRNTFCSLPDAVSAHVHAFNVSFPGEKPRSGLDERMVRDPIWSTWAIYKRDVNETVVMQYAQEILDNNFSNSQLEIDDFWETCYGELVFDTTKFPDPARLSNTLKSLGFRVTLWVHPFVNFDCPSFNAWREAGYFVHDENGNVNTTWWNGNSAAIVDFTNPEAKDWYIQRLIALKESSAVDAFKYDAGETSWMPKPRILTGDPALQPNIYTTDYVRALDVPELGSIAEVRSGFNSRDLPVFVRMVDKDTTWSINNGLRSLVTTLLQMNMVGYPFVLPDMIGGNGYGSDVITPELFIRWLQANTFMPSLQFSYVPWQFNDPQTISISHKFVDLHAQYSNVIMAAVEEAVSSARPINPPIFFAASSTQDPQGYAIDDEYMLGDEILVAPVMDEGAVTRDVFLPEGSWKDENTGTTYEGPLWLRDYPAPIDILPYFSRVQATR